MPVLRQPIAGMSAHAIRSQYYGDCLLDRLRLQLAAGLLRRTDLNVAEVGTQTGWSDPFHFSKVFKGAYAQSPTA